MSLLRSRACLVPLLWLALAVLTLPAPARACSCHEGAFTTEPAPGHELAQGGHILLEGSGSWSKRLGELGREGLMLTSGRERVRLRVERVFTGAALRASAVLVPTRRLKVNQSYSLVVRPPGSKRWIPLHVEGVPVRWRVVAAGDKGARPLDLKPVLSRAEVSGGGCGPSVSLAVRLAEGVGPVVLVSVSTPGRSNGSFHPLRVVEGEIKLEWGPCGGAFRLEPGERYLMEVRGVTEQFSPDEASRGSLELQVPRAGG